MFVPVRLFVKIYIYLYLNTYTTFRVCQPRRGCACLNLGFRFQQQPRQRRRRPPKKNNNNNNIRKT